MDLIYSQYIDMRGEKQNAGIEILLEEVIALSRKSLPDHIVVDEADIAIVTERNGDRRITHDRAPAPPGFMTLLFNEVEYPKTSGRASVSGSFIRVGKYEVLGQLLDDIYQRYLIDRFDPLTYGTKWILKGVRGWNDVVLVPWTSLTEDIDTDDARSWLMNTRINDCGLIEGTPWTVVTPRSEELLYGVGAKNRKLISIVLEQPKALFFALRQGIFRRADDPSELGGAGVSYVIGRGRMRLIREGRVFIQADCDEIKVDQFLQYWGRF
jgi:hypothetical protein